MLSNIPFSSVTPEANSFVPSEKVRLTVTWAPGTAPPDGRRRPGRAGCRSWYSPAGSSHRCPPRGRWAAGIVLRIRLGRIDFRFVRRQGRGGTVGAAGWGTEQRRERCGGGGAGTGTGAGSGGAGWTDSCGGRALREAAFIISALYRSIMACRFSMGLSSNPCRLRFLISIAVRRERVTKKMEKGPVQKQNSSGQGLFM